VADEQVIKLLEEIRDLHADSLPKLTADFCICIKDKGVLPTILGRLTQR
jgi:hypothetical protein